MKRIKLSNLGDIPSRDYVEQSKNIDDMTLFSPVSDVENRKQVKVGQHTRREGGKIVPVKTYFSARNVRKGEGELSLSELQRVEEVNDFINTKYRGKLSVNFTDKEASPEDEVNNSKKYAGALDMFGQKYTSVFGTSVSSIKVDGEYINQLNNSSLKHAQITSSNDRIIIKNNITKYTPDDMYLSGWIPENCNDPDSIMLHELGHQLDRFLSIGIGKNKLRSGIGDFHFDGIGISMSEIQNSFKMSNTEFVSEYSDSRATPTDRNYERWADSFAASVYVNKSKQSKYTKKQSIYLDFLYKNSSGILPPRDNGKVLHMSEKERVKYFNILKTFAIDSNIPALLTEVEKKLKL